MCISTKDAKNYSKLMNWGHIRSIIYIVLYMHLFFHHFYLYCCVKRGGNNSCRGRLHCADFRRYTARRETANHVLHRQTLSLECGRDAGGPSQSSHGPCVSGFIDFRYINLKVNKLHIKHRNCRCFYYNYLK